MLWHEKEEIEKDLGPVNKDQEFEGFTEVCRCKQRIGPHKHLYEERLGCGS